jgi:hypothetical protein
MRNGHHQNNNHKRMRGRHQHNNNQRRNQNPLTRAYESNGPDVKIRGTASTIAEKYIQLARDAQSSGDPVAAENYYQHAEHYFRLIAAAQEQFRQQNPQHFQPQQGGAPGQPVQQGSTSEQNYDDSDDDEQGGGPQNEPYAREQPQPYMQPREAQPSYPPRDQQQNRQQNFQQNRPRYNNHNNNSQPQQNDGSGNRDDNVGGLPSFITGGQSPQPGQDANGQSANGENGGQDGDRFPLHRRRRRHRGNRPDFGQGQDAAPAGQPEGGDEPQRTGE